MAQSEIFRAPKRCSIMKEQKSKDYKHQEREGEFHPSNGEESLRYGVNPEQAGINLKKKRKRI